MDAASIPAARVLGLDFGSRRIGVALTDALGFARPLLTLGGGNLRRAVRDLARLQRKHGVVAVVVGHPLHMSGETSPQAAKAAAFAAELRLLLPVPVHLQDERLSSTTAYELMDALGLPRGPQRTAKLDQYAAAVILQDWLDGEERAAAQRS